MAKARKTKAKLPKAQLFARRYWSWKDEVNGGGCSIYAEAVKFGESLSPWQAETLIRCGNGFTDRKTLGWFKTRKEALDAATASAIQQWLPDELR